MRSRVRVAKGSRRSPREGQPFHLTMSGRLETCLIRVSRCHCAVEGRGHGDVLQMYQVCLAPGTCPVRVDRPHRSIDLAPTHGLGRTSCTRVKCAFVRVMRSLCDSLEVYATLTVAGQTKQTRHVPMCANPEWDETVLFPLRAQDLCDGCVRSFCRRCVHKSLHVSRRFNSCRLRAIINRQAARASSGPS